MNDATQLQLLFRALAQAIKSARVEYWNRVENKADQMKSDHTPEVRDELVAVSEMLIAFLVWYLSCTAIKLGLHCTTFRPARCV